MLHKNEGHSGIDGKVLQKSCKGLQPSGGSACRDDRKRGQRQQVIFFGVPYNGTAVILCARCRRIIAAWYIRSRRSGHVVGIEGTPRRLPGFSHDCLHSCEPRKRHCAVCSPFDYASLWSTASIEVSRRYAGIHPEVRLTFEVAFLWDETWPYSRANIEWQR